MNNLKEKIEGNIFIVLIGLLITIGGAVFSVTTYFQEKKIESLKENYKNSIQKLEANILSIDRNVGEKKYFDIRNFIYSEGQQSSGSEYFTKGNFYANTQIENFSFQQFSEIDFIRKITNLSEKDIEAAALFNPIFKILQSEEYLNLTADAPIYSWISRDSIHYSIRSKTINEHQYMTVQKIKKEVILKVMNLGANFSFNLDEPIKIKNNDQLLKQKIVKKDTIGFNDLEKLKESLSNNLENDFISLFYYIIINMKFRAALNKNQSIEISKLQKLGNVLYMKSITKTPHCDYKGSKDVIHYETEELYLISDGKNFFQLRSVIPGFEPLPNSKNLAQLNIWLNSLKFITE